MGETPIKCGNCGKELTTDMEVEYSEWLSEWFCSPDCATDKYFDYMLSSVYDFSTPDERITIIDGKLYRKE